MKRLFIYLYILLLSVPGLGIENKKLKTEALPILRIAVYDLPPHIIASENSLHPSGRAIDFLLNDLQLQKHYQIRWRISPFTRFLADLEAENADMGLFLAKTSEREKLLRFCDHPIFSTEAAVILPKNTRFVGLKSLRGKVLGHTQDSVIPSYFKNSGVQFDSLSGDDVVKRNLYRLKLGRIDGVFVPTISNGEYLLKNLNMQKDFKIEKIPQSSMELYFVFRKDIDEKTFKTINSLVTKKRNLY